MSGGRIGAALAVAAASVVGCSGHVDSTSSAATEPDWISSRLELLPVPPGGDAAMEVRIGDVDRVTELVGVPRPADLSDRQAVADWSNAIVGQPVADREEDRLIPSLAAVPPADAMTPDMEERDWLSGDGRRGWNRVDVAWFAEVTPIGSTLRLTAVLGGTFSAERLTRSLGEPIEGVWTRDPASIGERGNSNAGMWAHAGLAGDDLVVSEGAETVRVAKDPASPRLSDNDALAQLAAALDAQGAYSPDDDVEYAGRVFFSPTTATRACSPTGERGRAGDAPMDCQGVLGRGRRGWR